MNADFPIPLLLLILGSVWIVEGNHVDLILTFEFQFEKTGGGVG